MSTKEEQRTRKLPSAMGVHELLEVEEPEEEWLVEEILPTGNILLAAYPKSYKTMLLLALAVALASGTAFFGRFRVPKRRRVGLVLMEDQAHRVRRRLERLCAGMGITLPNLEGWLFLWFRPPLRLTDVTALDLAEYSRELGLDFLGIDSWSYVASGDSNSADDVVPQLQSLSLARQLREGLSVLLVHHARKEGGKPTEGTRLTDIIRNSSAFGAWYDAGLVLARKNETSPVTVRVELRDFGTPDAFAFTVEDEDPAGPHNRFRSSGWLRLQVSDYRPELVERMAAVEKLAPAVRDFLGQHPEGVSMSALRRGVTGRNADIDDAFRLLEKAGEAEHIPSEGQGKAAILRLLRRDPAPPCPDPAPGKVGGDPAHPAPPPVGGGRGQGSPANGGHGIAGGRGRVAVEGSDVSTATDGEKEEAQWLV